MSVVRDCPEFAWADHLKVVGNDGLSKSLTWPSTTHLEMDVFPSSPARNFSVAERGLIFEITKFDGGPGSSGIYRHKPHTYTMKFDTEFAILYWQQKRGVNEYFDSAII